MSDPIWPWQAIEIKEVEIYDHDTGERTGRIIPGWTKDGHARRFEISYDSEKKVLVIK